MTAKYFAILTNQGAARLANAAALGTKLNLTQMAVGDANGTLPTPDPAQTKLINQKRIAPLNLLTVDPANTSQIIAEQIIPENEGGFWIREIGLYDDAGVLIAVANCPETYKPQLQEGSGRTQTIRMILIVSSTSAITLKIDPSVVLATRQYVDDKVIEVKAYADNLLAAHLAAADPHAQYLKTADIDKYIPVGFPLPWPQATPPDGWLKCNGAAFDKAKYPKLAVAYPSGNLPDLRGEFLRGWDDGRGVDSGRGILTSQGDAIRDITGGTAVSNYNGWLANGEIKSTDGVGAIKINSVGGRVYAAGATSGSISTNWFYWDFAASRIVPTAAENRPRNIAFNYIVRAA
ncbi:phage tail protein [Escherichia coli]|uniref:phage tail-collar fiber domain-containing protein n=1 Tax=Escherichia coli TaxID=562 RepID=UPI000B8E9D08|nr:phage tail protein [Escherichia coli]EKH5295264.1 phage tail protein [Escherichia coli O26]EKH6185790.1 phage tail protein [Escherichia coli O111]EKH6195107.1 phage tail protein [Escherichia coli O103]EKJ1986555.1 phage tail protein [Escherichia coli O104]EKY3873078.1 phage tail protein [Escherichia coli O157]